MQLFAGELTNQNREYYKVNDNIKYVYPHTYNNYQYPVILGLTHFSLTGTVSTSPNLAKEGARQSLLALRARALAKFGEVDTVRVSGKYTKHRGNSVPVLSRHFDL